jgi:hypothetical protein
VSDNSLIFMTGWDDSPGVFIAMMALSVICLWLSLRYVFRNLKRRRRWLWRRLSYVLLPVVIALLILSDYLFYLLWTYRYILDRPHLW